MAVHEALALIPNSVGQKPGFCGGGYGGESRAARVVARWHDQDSGHLGAFSVCTEQPCEAVRRVDG
jgi:hypothetical protein